MKKSLISHELKSVRQLAFRRSVSISQLSSTGNSSRTTSINFDVNNNGSNGVEEITLNVPDSANPQFQKMGNTSSLLSFNLPPSVPVYIKNGSLVSLYGSSISGKKTNNSISSVTSQLEIISPIKRFFYGGFTSSYKKLISTVPFNVLVSTDSRKNFLSRLFIKTSVSEKSFVNLSLDGRIDWAVFPTRALHSYSDDSLIIKNELIPRTISSKLANTLQLPRRTSTGLFRYLKAGYTFISGRGYVSLTGIGQVYQVSLKENEEFLIQRDNLLALTINGESDLASAVTSYNFSGNAKRQNKPVETQPGSALEPNLGSKIHQYLNQVKSSLKFTTNIATSYSNKIYNSLTGNNNFVKILGPRNILLQSNSNFQLTSGIRNFNRAIDLNEITKTEKLIKSSHEFSQPKKSSADYLSYVTVKDGKAEFRNTPNFNDTVRKIEEAATKKV